MVALGLVTLFASRYILPETLFPWINLVAAALVVAVGVWVARGRLASLRRRLAHRRAHARGLAHDHGPRARTDTSTPTGPRRRWRWPAPPRTSTGTRTRTRTTTATATATGTGPSPPSPRRPGGHTHAPPEDLSMRSLLAVGAAAGIIPCPSALVLLLGAIALDRVGYGLVLVLAFSVGLAGLLSLIGLLVIYARRFIERLPLDGRIASAIPALSALAIIALGVVLMAKAIPPLL